MSRLTFILAHETARRNALSSVAKAPDGFRVEVKPPKRTTAQNDYLWACLTDISQQATLNGKRYNTEQWKCIFMKALGHEVDFLPTLDGQAFFPTGFRSSDLGKAEMVALIDYIVAWGAQNGVKFHDAKDDAA